MVKKLKLEDYKEIYSKVPRLCVEAVIRKDDGIIFSKRKVFPSNIWHIPGGTVLLGENLKQAIQRVVKEEINVEVNNIEFLTIQEYSPKSGFGQAISIVYEMTYVRGEFKPDEYTSEIKVFSKNPKGLLEEHKQILKKININ